MSNSAYEFEYLLLGRLEMDCQYYLGAGGRNRKHLWALDEALQIEEMKRLYECLPVKPEWISLETINGYEARMGMHTSTTNGESVEGRYSGPAEGHQPETRATSWKDRVGRRLFESAAAFNILGAIVLTLMPKSMEDVLRMPTGAVSTIFGQCFIAFILLFAGMYWCVSNDPKKYRPYIVVGAVAKIAVVTIVFCHWLTGEIGPALPSMVIGDLLFASAFWFYLLPTRQNVPAPPAFSVDKLTLRGGSQR